MSRKIKDIRQEEAFYHINHYQNYSLESQDSWLGYPVKELIELGIDISNKKDTTSFLDLGCGIGRNSIPIVTNSQSSYLKVDCVDILSSAIEQFSQFVKRNNFKESFNFFISDIVEFNFFDKTYDFIFSVSTLEHLRDKNQLIKILNTIRNSVVKEGYIYLVLNTEVTEFLKDEQQEIIPFIEINLSTSEMYEVLNCTFKDWVILSKETKKLSFQIERSIGDVEMTTNAITFVAQKID